MGYKKALSIISFILVMLALVTAIVTDIVIFKDAIVTFISAIIVGAATFVFMIIAMVLSIMLIFGVFLLEQNGFWPLDLAVNAFKEVLQDIVITPDQIHTFITLRIVLLIVCITTLVLSSIAKHHKKGEKVPLRGMSIVTFIFSILGIVAAFGLIVIASAVA